MRYLDSSIALSRPIWSFCTIAYLQHRVGQCQWCVSGVSAVCQRCVSGVSAVCQRCVSGVSWNVDGLCQRDWPGTYMLISLAMAVRTERFGRRPFWICDVGNRSL